MELGHLVCGVHAQRHEVPCGADRVGSPGWLSSCNIIPTPDSEESKEAKFEPDLL